VTYVREHKRASTDGTYVTPAHFRLGSNVDHAVSCLYNLTGYVQQVYAQSNSDVLEELANGQYEFRLHLLSGPLRALGFANRARRAGTAEDPLPGQQLDPYLSVLGQVLELRAAVYADALLADLIQLKLEGRSIPWDEFYFAFGEYFDSYDLTRRQDRAPHLMCLEGDVGRVVPANSPEGVPIVYLKGHTRAPAEGVTEVISPRVRFRNGVPTPRAGARVLVFGDWYAEREGVGDGEGQKTFLRLATNVYRSGQVLVLP
jgi:hypothetical protein